MVLIVILHKNKAYLAESQKSEVKTLKSLAFIGLYDFKTLKLRNFKT